MHSDAEVSIMELDCKLIRYRNDTPDGPSSLDSSLGAIQRRPFHERILYS